MTRMPLVRLGNSDADVSKIGLGCMGMSEFYGSVDESQAKETIARALDLGITMLDTADMYGDGRNERLVGDAVGARRERAFIATKFGNVRAPDGTPLGIDGRPEYVRTACDASLARLGVETIDLYYQHRVDPDTPIEETVGAMSDLVAAGKVRYLGLSEAGPDTIRRAHATHPISALQTEYSLWTRHVEVSILPTCRNLGITLVAYSPLGRGFLTGRFTGPDDLAPDDTRRRHPRFQEGNFERNLRIVDVIGRVADRHSCTNAQVALAWVLGRGNDVVPIPGTKRVEYLDQNVAALDVRLTSPDIDELTSAIAPDEVVGERYPPRVMKTLET